MAKGSEKLLLTALVLVLIVFAISLVSPLGFLKIVRWVFLVAFLLLVLFFRDPDRKIPSGAENIISPADGKVVSIEHENNRKRVAIFMSLFNVHVNRVPVSGKVIVRKHSPGQYLPAFNPNCHLKNEQCEIIIQHKDIKVKAVQIAGLVARKIVNYLEKEDYVKAGQRYGMIKLGSRVDVEFPDNCPVQVEKGQKVRAGQTIIAKIERG